MSGEIDFEAGDPVWQVELYHNTPDTNGYWTIALNAKDESEAIEKAVAAFEDEGLPAARIINIIPWVLELLNGGENGGSTAPGLAEGEGEGA